MSAQLTSTTQDALSRFKLDPKLRDSELEWLPVDLWMQIVKETVSAGVSPKFLLKTHPVLRRAALCTKSLWNKIKIGRGRGDAFEYDRVSIDSWCSMGY
jgi:hypothetical protein